MKKLFLSILIILTVHFNGFSKPSLQEKIATSICKCINENETNPDSVINYTNYKSCIISEIKPLKKELKKFITKAEKQAMKADDDNDDEELNLFSFLKEIDQLLKINCKNYSSEKIMDSIFFE